jgi:hypothetical protein
MRICLEQVIAQLQSIPGLTPTRSLNLIGRKPCYT